MANNFTEILLLEQKKHRRTKIGKNLSGSILPARFDLKLSSNSTIMDLHNQKLNMGEQSLPMLE